jgi:hypothetical protein
MSLSLKATEIHDQIAASGSADYCIQAARAAAAKLHQSYMRVLIADDHELYRRLHSALGYRSPEEFEQQIQASASAESRSATMVFFENSENEERGSIKLTGEGDSNAVPFPRPHPLLGDTKTSQ